jgi:hypothetical protein
MDLTMKTESFGVDDMSWLGSRHGIGNCVSVTLDTSAFTEGIHYPNGFFKSGIALAKITASGLYGPYAGQSNEVQTLTEGGSGLTSFTITFSGQTTASIDDDATAAEVQAALIALSNIDPGDVVVTGGPLGTGPFTVTFGGQYAGTNVAAMTTTPTGGTGTVVVATSTAGGASPAADGLDVLAGFLFGQVAAPASTSTDVVGAMLDHGKVVNNRLPVPVDSAGRADVAGRIIFL